MVFDNYIFFSMFLLLVIGGLLQLSVSDGKFFFKHLLFVVTGAFVFWLGYSIQVSLLKNIGLFIYLFSILLLLFVVFKGSQALGAQRWLCITEGFCIQPSEPAKLANILALASWLQDRPIKTIKDLACCGLMILFLPFILIFIQPDLGTSLVLVSIFLGVTYWAGAKVSQILLLCSPVLIVIFSSISFKLGSFSFFNLSFQQIQIFGSYLEPNCSLLGLIFIFLFLFFLVFAYRNYRSKLKIFYFFFFGVFSLFLAFVGRPFAWGLLKEYQQNRLIVFLDPYKYPLKEGYNILQSLLSIGNGGIWGEGYRNGTLTQGKFVPEQHTDFIFSAIAEEFGFLGVLVTLVLFFVICFRLLLIAYRTKKSFERLICIGVFTLLFFHIFVNIGMNCSLMPVVGMPLPLLSYGGTALWVSLFSLGITQRVYLENKKNKVFSTF